MSKESIQKEKKPLLQTHQPDAETTGKKSKRLFTHQLRSGKQDMITRPSGGFISTYQPLGKNPIGYIQKYGTEKEIDELVKKIEARRAKLPKVIYLICDKCGDRLKLPFGDRDVRAPKIDYCFRCNRDMFKEGGKMRPMTAREAKKFDKDENEKWKQINERMFKAELFHLNQERQKNGRDPLTEEQFRERKKREWQAQFGAKK